MRTKTLDDSTQASDPGGIRLSHEKMRRFHPDLYGVRGFLGRVKPPTPEQRVQLTRAEEHLMHGDSRAAIVVSTEPLLVAAYTDELDCAAVLRFPDDLASEYGLEVGSRLLTVNLYGRSSKLAADLWNGPASHHRWTNFSPFIAEFLSEDLERIAERKVTIPEAEWQRTADCAEEYRRLNRNQTRDGRPLRCHLPPA